MNRKYANLPDLDSAPDTYETPSLTDDNSTAPTGRPRTDSSASSYKDFDDDDDINEGISRSHLDTAAARSKFLPAQIDAKDVDFSDRVNAKRKSYKVSTRRQRQLGADPEEYGDMSDEESESLERRLARLQREVEEVKVEFASRQIRGSTKEDHERTEADITTLNSSLESIMISQVDSSHSLSHYTKHLKNTARASPFPPTDQASNHSDAYTITYAPTYEESHALAKAVDFDERLTLLEDAIGVSSSHAFSSTSKAVIPNIDLLSQQMALLSKSSPSLLENVGSKVRKLTADADALRDSRIGAKKAKDELRASGADATDEAIDDSEQVVKINALYGTLSTIEDLAPILPPLLDRLRSLKAIHANAGRVSDILGVIEKKQIEQAEEIKRWKEGLTRVEDAIKNGEQVMSGNVKTVEAWVKALEERLVEF